MAAPIELLFVTLNVFTTARFQGNPLAIILVPAGISLSQETKQLVAREFNLSETVFLHESPDGGHEFPADIFTTTAEVPFAGHPTIGTSAYVLGKYFDADKTGGERTAVKPEALVVKAGRIPIEPVRFVLPDSVVVRASVPHDVHIHRGHLRSVDNLDAIRRSGALGYGNPEIEAAELDAPVASIVRGMTSVLVCLPSLDLLGQISPSGTGLDFKKVSDLLDEGRWADGHVNRYYYVVLESKDEDGVTTTSIRTRMIGFGEEDPATGSAACTLASYLSLQQADAGTTASKLLRYNVTQGVEMGRRSDILVEVQMKAGTQGIGTAIDKVYLGGSAVKVMEGTILV